MPAPMQVAKSGVPEPIRWAFAGFALTGLFIFLGASLLKPDMAPGFAPTERAEVLPDGTFRVTVNVRNRDAWIPLDLSLGRIVATPASADLLLRRYKFQCPNGAAKLDGADLLSATHEGVTEWLRDVAVDGELQNPALARWYHYGMQSHLLDPKDTVYAVRLHGGGVAVFQIESYYCDPDGSGCMTLRYRLTP